MATPSCGADPNTRPVSGPNHEYTRRFCWIATRQTGHSLTRRPQFQQDLCGASLLGGVGQRWWFPRGPGHDVEAGHEDDVARGLEAHDALLLALVRDSAPRLFLGDLRRAARWRAAPLRRHRRVVWTDAESRTFAVAAARASDSSASLAESHRAGATSRSRNCSTSGRPAGKSSFQMSSPFTAFVNPSQPALCGHCQEGDV